MGREALKKEIFIEDIFDNTDKGLDVFEKEIPNLTLTKNVRSPFHNDKTPSFRVKLSSTSGLYIGIDYSTGKSYNAISFIQELYNLSYKEAIEKIAWEFKLSERKVEKGNKLSIKKDKILINSHSIIYEFEEIRFKKRHHDYWNPGELYEDFLRENNIFAASKIANNRKVIKIPEDEMCFVYIPSDLDYGKLKILRIGKNIKKENKWKSNINGDYIWNLWRYNDKKVDNLWILKSLKDEMVIKLLGKDTCSTQSENSFNLNNRMSDILNICSNPIICFGSDKQGVNSCKIIQSKYNCRYYNTPKSCLPEINDPFSYVSKFGLRQLERHINLKFKKKNE